MSTIAEQVRARVDRLQIPFNSAGIDPYGVSKVHLRRAAELFTLAYRNYFRVECRGIANVPTQGRCMLVGNHSGGVAVDGGMLAAACFWELDPPRLAHGMVDRFLQRLPFVSEWSSRLGQFAGLPEHARRLLLDDRLLMVFPEGTRGTAKLFKERHSLVRFGTGFMRLAMEARAPIVPVAILGGGEAVPTIMNLRRLGKLLGTPYIPLTPYVVAAPLPAKIMILFGEPMRFEAPAEDNDAVIAERVELVRSAIFDLIEEGRREYHAL